MDGRELLNAAFGEIALDYVAFAEQPPARRAGGIKWLGIAAACVAIVLAMLPFVMKISRNEPPIDPSLGHTHEFVASEVVLPTCTERGYTVYRCTVEGCEETELREFTEATGHLEFDTVTVENKCVVGGYKADRCLGCGIEVNKREFTTARLHDFEECEDGYVCAHCGEVRKESEMPPTFAQLVQSIRVEKILVKGDINELTLGTLSGDGKELGDGRFYLEYMVAEYAEIWKDSLYGEKYLRVHLDESLGGTSIYAKVNGARYKEITAEFSVRLGELNRYGKYVDWSGYWRWDHDRERTVHYSFFVDENGVLTFANSEYSLQLDSKNFAHLKLVYRFDKNSYDVYIDGVLCDSDVPIFEDGCEYAGEFMPEKFVYGSTVDGEEYDLGYLDLGSLVIYTD